MERCRIAVLPRPGVAPDEVTIGDAHWLDAPALPVSGTELRRRARAGKSIRFMVPEPVYHYVAEHDLYG